jgi:hypothetical protein
MRVSLTLGFYPQLGTKEVMTKVNIVRICYLFLFSNILVLSGCGYEAILKMRDTSSPSTALLGQWLRTSSGPGKGRIYFFASDGSYTYMYNNHTIQKYYEVKRGPKFSSSDDKTGLITIELGPIEKTSIWVEGRFSKNYKRFSGKEYCPLFATPFRSFELDYISDKQKPD